MKEENVADRLKLFRIYLKLKQSEFAEMVGTRQQLLTKYECGVNEPASKFYVKLCKNTNINLNWLMTGKGEMLVNKTDKAFVATAQYPDAVEIKYYDDPKVSSTIRSADITNFWLDRELIHNVWKTNEKNLCILKMPGDTMDGGEAPIKNGDLLIIDTSAVNLLCAGIYAYTTMDGNYIFVNILKPRPDGSLKLCYWNNAYDEIIYTKDQLQQLRFNPVGMVLKNMSI